MRVFGAAGFQLFYGHSACFVFQNIAEHGKDQLCRARVIAQAEQIKIKYAFTAVNGVVKIKNTHGLTPFCAASRRFYLAQAKWECAYRISSFMFFSSRSKKRSTVFWSSPLPRTHMEKVISLRSVVTDSSA